MDPIDDGQVTGIEYPAHRVDSRSSEDGYHDGTSDGTDDVSNDGSNDETEDGPDLDFDIVFRVLEFGEERLLKQTYIETNFEPRGIRLTVAMLIAI